MIPVFLSSTSRPHTPRPSSSCKSPPIPLSVRATGSISKLDHSRISCNTVDCPLPSRSEAKRISLVVRERFALRRTMSVRVRLSTRFEMNRVERLMRNPKVHGGSSSCPIESSSWHKVHDDSSRWSKIIVFAYRSISQPRAGPLVRQSAGLVAYLGQKSEIHHY